MAEPGQSPTHDPLLHVPHLPHGPPALTVVQPPAPSQLTVLHCVVPGQEYAVPPQRPAPSHLSPNVQAFPSLHPVPGALGLQVPIDPGMEGSLQDWQTNVHAESQQTPWAQIPVVHCPALMQPTPRVSFGTQALPEQ
jgi:hypothetical protein